MYELLLFLLLLVLGYAFGSIAERRHLKSIREREIKLKHLPSIMLKRPLHSGGITQYRLVNGSVVLSIDFFKKFVASLVNLFGGNMVSYETIVDRARREAILRMKESAGDASEIINIRVETSSISKSTDQGVGAIEVLAYGTAIYREQQLDS